MDYKEPQSTKNKEIPVDGILNISKPKDITTMDVVRHIKITSGQKRVGHGGTLDPMATGVVPICFGQSTRMMEYLIEKTKEYVAQIEFGVETDTYDALGKITEKKDASHINLQILQTMIDSFVGSIEQIPPMFSALKQNGRRLYELARAGIEVGRTPRKVEVMKIHLLNWSYPIVTLEITCGRGFYVRSLAHDLGLLLGCGGHLKSLVRTRSGPFKLSESMNFEDFSLEFSDGTWRKSLHSTDIAVRNLKTIIVGKHLEDMICHGQPIPTEIHVPPLKPNELCRAYSINGAFLAILSFNTKLGQWQPSKVIASPLPSTKKPRTENVTAI